MMDSACAEYECAAQAETGCWNRDPTACFCMICARPSISRRRSVYPQAMQMLASPWSAASLYFSDCSQKHIFPWRYFRTLERARERHGFIRRVLFEPLRVMHDDFSFFIALTRQIDEICYRSATNGKFNLLFSSHKSIQTSFLSDAHMLLYSQSLAESV